MKLFADSRVTYLFVVVFFKQYEHGNSADLPTWKYTYLVYNTWKFCNQITKLKSES